jgi:hypothetical protein
MAVGDGTLLKYGPIKGVEHAGVPMVITASQIFEPASAKFVLPDATTGTLRLVAAGDAKILGHLEIGAVTASAGDVGTVILGNAPVVYRVPVKYSLYASVVQACVGDVCDLELNTIGSNTMFQTAAVGTTTRGHLIIVGFDPNMYVDCIINPNILGSA